jgi:predicted glycoside hydrolase/deacetylase ChbG (UPF0249 family)
MATSTSNNAIRLIVNADDYGYFQSVSRGILDAADKGMVNATGIMATGQCLDEMLPLLAANTRLDAGVHLNLTYGEPVTVAMRQALENWGGRYPGKYKMALAILSGKIPLDVIEQELSSQVEYCGQGGTTLRFLNSHQHIHMLPSIYRMTLSLARRFSIPFVRHTTADWTGYPGAGDIVRNSIIQVLGSMSSMADSPSRVTCIGVGRSGKLDLGYLRKLFAQLQPGKVYELMCHPGYFNPAEILDTQLIDYHAWDAEYALLTGEGMQQLCGEYSIQLTRYRDLLDE